MRTDRNIYNQFISQQPVGFCHCKSHKGALTVQLMKKHCCLSRCCGALQKNDDHPFWRERAEKKKRAKQRKQQFNAMIIQS